MKYFYINIYIYTFLDIINKFNDRFLNYYKMKNDYIIIIK